MRKPHIYKPDGELTDQFIFKTTLPERFFSGVLPPNTVDVQISIRGGAFVSNPDLIVFEDRAWSCPNSEVYSNGLELVSGENHIQLRAIDTRGNTSDILHIKVSLIQDDAIYTLSKPPTNISLSRQRDSVTITCEGVDDPYIVGYNFYASTEQGGGGVGYSRININTVRSGTTKEDFVELQDISFLEEVATQESGDPYSDPQYFSVITEQRDILGNIFQQKEKGIQEIPEGTESLKISYNVSSVRTTTMYSFTHNRFSNEDSNPPTIFYSEFLSIAREEPLFYVVSAVFFDDVNNIEFESVYSPEIVGTPISVSLVGTDLPQVSRNQIRENFISSIYRSNPQLRVDPTSVISDTVIEPFSSEMERVRFLMDFFNKSVSLAGLLQIDDPNNTGQSELVNNSNYKTALQFAFRLSNNNTTQTFIDSLIEARVQNFGIRRRDTTRSSGEVTFFVNQIPTSSIIIPRGTTVSGGSRTFSTIQEGTINLSNIASYYNPALKRWEISLPVQADSGGALGNVAQGLVRSTNLAGVKVINNASFFGGSDRETNHQLIMRTMNAISGSDVGTERGFLQLAADIVGVQNIKVVASGHDLMQRDKDSLGIHRGGKVDIWVRTNNPAQVTDSFAFSYSLAKDITFEVVGSPKDLIFKAIDPELSVDSPILKLLSETDRFAFRNGSTGQQFDITGSTIIQYNMVQLSADVDQPEVSYGDIIFGDYRRQEGNMHLLTRQPVESIVEVEGTISGVLPSSAYELVNPSVPLEEGFSVKENSSLRIKGFTEEGVRVPSGDSITVTDEKHVVLLNYPEYLNNLGIDPLTVTVTNLDKTITYRDPSHPSGISDFTLEENDGLPLSLFLTDTTEIRSGQEVLVSYAYDENFTVTYRISSSVSTAQNIINQNKPLTADVLVKKSLAVPVDIEATVVVGVGVDMGSIDRSIRTSLANFFANLSMGEPVRQSDIVEILDSTRGVSYVILPITRMTRQENAMVLREKILVGQFSDYTLLSRLSGVANVFLLDNPLDFSAQPHGGVEADFRGVFQDQVLLETLFQPNNYYLGASVGRAYIIGDGGLSIQGLTDDGTLSSEGYSPNEYETIRKERTANRVMISLPKGSLPTDYSYTATYYVGYDKGVKNVDPIDAEYLTLGDVSVTYEEDASQVRSLQTGSSIGGSSYSPSSGGGSSSGGSYGGGY